MASRPRKTFQAGVLVLLAFAAPACADRAETPTAPGTPPPSAPLANAILLQEQSVTCTGSIDNGGTLTCEQPASGVELLVTNVFYDHAVGDFTFDVALRNLIPQPIGTTDTTATLAPDPGGIMVLLGSESTGGGRIMVRGDVVNTYLLPNPRAFYRYNTVLQPNQVSAPRRWRFSMSFITAPFTFEVILSVPVPYPNGWIDLTPAGTQLLAGGTRQLSAVARTAVGTPISGNTFTWSSFTAQVATVSQVGVVTGGWPGTATIRVSDGTRIATARVEVCPNLAVGGVETIRLDLSSGFCLGGLAGGAEYVLTLIDPSTPSIPLVVRGTGIVPAFGPPTPTRLPAGRTRLSGARRPQPDGAWERRLRERERRELTGRIASLPRSARTSAGSAPRFSIVPGEPLPGDLMELNVETDNTCSTQDLRTGEVKGVGAHVIVMADVANPAGGLTAADYQEVADGFDTQVWPVIAANFGAPEDIDANGRVIVFYTRAVNERVPSGGAHVPGFFLSRDLFSAFSCPTSNVGEMIYMMAADPSGAVNGNARSVALVKGVAAITLAHEMQHLVNASRRLYVNSAPSFEEIWLDEGLSAIAEELLFYQAAGVQPTQNLDVAQLVASPAVTDAFFAYAEPNFARLRQWLLAPTASGLSQTDDDAATRGAAWAYLRYVAHYKGGNEAELWSAMVNSTSTGPGTVMEATLASAYNLMYDFTVATYTDDAGINVSATWTQPAWNFRSVYGALDYDGDGFGDGFPLAVRNPANGVGDAFTLVGGGGAAFVRMGVAANTFGSVSVTNGTTLAPPIPRLVVVRRR